MAGLSLNFQVNSFVSPLKNKPKVMSEERVPMRTSVFAVLPGSGSSLKSSTMDIPLSSSVLLKLMKFFIGSVILLPL